MSRQMLWFGGIYFLSVSTLAMLTFLERAALRLVLDGAHRFLGS